MKKDIAIAVAAILVVAAVCFGLAQMRPPFPPTKSEPFSLAPVGPTLTGTIVMRVNGEPITQAEFEAAFLELPDEMKQQFNSGPGKQAFAEQYVRMKLLEQEGRKTGVDKDNAVRAQIAADATNIIARATAAKIVTTPTPQTLQSFYDEHTKSFATIDISHILIAYAGGSVPPRNGGAPPSEVDATNLALKIYEQLKSGGDFAALARKYSDDTTSLDTGGRLGQFRRGMLPPELDARVWDIPAGQFSGPIPSRFGVHIFKVNSRNTAPFAQVRAQIAQHVKEQNTLDRVELLRKNANVTFDPKYFPEAKDWPSNAPKTPARRPS